MPVKKTKNDNEFKLPRYLKLNKGAMFLDDDPEDKNASGVRIFATNKVLTGREVHQTGRFNKDNSPILKFGDVTKDKFKNNSTLDFGYVESELPWYVDTKTIPTEKLSRIIKAYQSEILVEADISEPLVPVTDTDVPDPNKNFSTNTKGDRVFVGKNAEMYKKLQNLSFKDLKVFVSTTPITSYAKENLIDLYHYEQLGYNPLSRPRLEVLDLVKSKLNEFGPGMSAIRVNED